jgi:hypothetical protein
MLGFSAGALYQSDIASLKSYRLPPWFTRYMLPLIGETRAVHRTTRALAATNLSETTPRLDDEVITTAHTPTHGGFRPFDLQRLTWSH